MQRSGTDNQVELRAAVNAAVRANVAIYPVDSRGLQAVVPGGSARQGSRGGVGAFSGQRGRAAVHAARAQQETLTTLAADTGGTAFTDTNDFGEAFTKVEKDISSYYILGFASTNPAKDGRFRRITVRAEEQVRTRRSRRARATTPTATSRTRRRPIAKSQLQEQLTTPIPATDVPLFVTAGWFRLAADRYYVPVSLAVPGSAVPPSQRTRVTLDVAGFIRDERGAPVGRIRDTLTVPPASADDLAARQVLYQTGVTLPPGRFSVKIVVRENTTGQMGTFETPIVVPELKQAPVKVSSLVLEHAAAERVGPQKTASPLVRDGVELVPNLTHIVEPRSEAVLLLRGLRSGADGGAPQRAHEPGVLSRQGQGVRNAGRRARRSSTRRIARPRSSSSRCRPTASSPGSTPARSTSSTRSRAASRSRGSRCTCASRAPGSTALNAFHNGVVPKPTRQAAAGGTLRRARSSARKNGAAASSDTAMALGPGMGSRGGGRRAVFREATRAETYRPTQAPPTTA